MEQSILKRTLRLMGIAMVSFALVAGCSSPTDSTDDDDDNGGGSPPPTEREPTFTNVSQIFNGSCGGSSCHLSSPFESGVNLSSYDNVMSSVGEQYGKEIIEEGDASHSASPLVDKINTNPEFGERMPQGGPYLDQEDIDLIVDWINEGAQDN